MSSTDEHSSVLATLHEWEQKVKESDGLSIVARWEFGRAILPLREDKQLPKGLLSKIVDENQPLSKTEIWQRVKFAEKFPTKEEVLACARTYPTWDRIKRKVLPKEPTAAGRQNAHAREAERLAERLEKDNPNDLTDAERQAYETLYKVLGALLNLQ